MKRWFLPILVMIFGILSFLILKPYLNYIIFAAILVFLTYPLYKKLATKLKGKAVSALILIVCILLIAIIPSLYFSTTLFLQARNVFSSLSTVELEKLKTFEETTFSRIGIKVNIVERINDALANLGTSAISYFMNNIAKLTKTVANIFIGFFLMVFTMFYLYVDGERITNGIKELIPLEEKYKNYFFKKSYNITQALFLGIFLVAIVQGLVAGIGYLIFGIPNPIFWGLLTTILAIIPVLGAPWVYVPLSLYLMYKGSLLAGICLLLYGIIIVSQIDNFIRPKLVRIRADIHPLTIILGVIGGTTLFGFLGLIIGPFILALFIELLEVYKMRKR